jgi:homoserine dehydrogenase
VRLAVQDRPGVLADITAALRDAGVSIESLIQPASAADGTALIVMLTHECSELAVRRALDAMAALPTSTATPLFMPILPEDG